MLLRGCGQWYRCGRDRVARPSEQENLDPRPQRNRRRQEDVSKGEPSRRQTSLHSRSSDLTWCLRCLLLVMCTYPFAKKALTLHLAHGEGRERYFGCNLMQRKVLASSHQHLIAEAPKVLPNFVPCQWHE